MRAIYDGPSVPVEHRLAVVVHGVPLVDHQSRRARPHLFDLLVQRLELFGRGKLEIPSLKSLTQPCFRARITVGFAAD
jgi:hypothetical protein